MRQATRSDHTGHAGQIARWAIAIDEHDFKLEYRKGREMWVADALSRDPRFEQCKLVMHRHDLMPDGIVAPVIGQTRRTARVIAMEAAAAARAAAAQPAATEEAAAAPAFQWAGSEAAEAAARRLRDEAAAARDVQMPGWPDDWGHLAPDDTRLLQQAAVVRQQQLADPQLGPLLRYLEQGTHPDGATAARRARTEARATHYRSVAGLLHHEPTVPLFEDALALQLAIPAVTVPQLLRETHAGVLGGARRLRQAARAAAAAILLGRHVQRRAQVRRQLPAVQAVEGSAA